MSASRIFVVHGPPGTGLGKTTFLARQAARAAAEHGPDQVAIASLTRAAAAEIAGRDTGIPDESVGTLHAHCYRGLEHPNLAETPEGIRAWNEEHPAQKLTAGPGDQLEDTPIEHADTGHTGASETHAQVTNHRARLTPPEQWTDEQRAWHAEWNDWKRQTDRLDFTDLIERGLTELAEHPLAPRVLLLDEAQDFSRLELALAQRWAAHTDTTVIVGDSDQCLFSFRGSDPDTLATLPAAGTRVLEQSHRVPRAVHALAARWIGQIANRPDIAYRPTEHDGQARRLAVSLRNPAPLIGEITEDLEAGRTVMVLTACGYQLAPVLRALRDAGLPFHNPARITQGAWNPLRGAGRLLAYLRPDERAWGEQARTWTWGDLEQWTEPLQAAGTLTRGAKAYIEEKNRVDQFGQSSAASSVPLEQLCTLLGVGEDLDHPAFRLDVDWWASRLRAKRAQAMTYPIEVLRRRGPRALRETPQITTGTIHSVKGGECSSCYLFPDLSKQGMWHGWHPGGPGRDQIVRMLYVALTRARERVTILDPAGPEHVPMDLLDPSGLAVAA